MQQAKIITIIVTYNGAKCIEKCLSFLLGSSYATSIIVIDNQSTDNTVALLQPFSEKIIFIQSATNEGFGAGNNIGIKKAIELNADYIFLFNQDAYVRHDCIETLVKTAQQFPQFGILSPMQLEGSGQALDLLFQKQLSRTVKNIPEISFHNYLKNYEIVKPLPARFVAAASWFIPVHVIKEVGLFHPVFYHYGEDNNYAARLQYFQYKIGVVSNTAIVHDRMQRRDDEKFLVMKLRTFPLYMLLDIRKPFYIAFLLGLNQLKRYRSKLEKIAGDKYEYIYKEQRKWFSEKVKEAKQIRKETKANPVF